MSVYIKGMERPKNCGECLFYRLESAGNGMYFDYCAEKRGAIYDPDNEKESDCPLIPVPPHGRLIDADALMENAQYKGAYDIVTAWDIVAAPTIIPAEEGDNKEVNE